MGEWADMLFPDEEPKSRQVWCVAYDSDTPTMDGSVPAIRMAEVSSLETVRQQMRVIEERSTRAPKKNLRIETRLVTDWRRA